MNRFYRYVAITVAVVVRVSGRAVCTNANIAWPNFSKTPTSLVRKGLCAVHRRSRKCDERNRHSTFAEVRERYGE